MVGRSGRSAKRVMNQLNHDRPLPSLQMILKIKNGFVLKVIKRCDNDVSESILYAIDNNVIDRSRETLRQASLIEYSRESFPYSGYGFHL
jgi:hypothetical protein